MYNRFNYERCFYEEPMSNVAPLALAKGDTFISLGDIERKEKGYGDISI